MAQAYFVYELVDPRCGSVFYVGKGKGDRPRQHERDARKGAKGRKCDRIRAIIEAGHRPSVNIVKRFHDELEAYAEEALHIERLGIANLTNICIGGIGAITPRDEKKEARKVVRACVNQLRKAVALQFAGLSIFIGDHDITHVVSELLASLKERAGSDWFDDTVGRPEWQPA